MKAEIHRDYYQNYEYGNRIMDIVERECQKERQKREFKEALRQTNLRIALDKMEREPIMEATI